MRLDAIMGVVVDFFKRNPTHDSVMKDFICSLSDTLCPKNNIGTITDERLGGIFDVLYHDSTINIIELVDFHECIENILINSYNMNIVSTKGDFRKQLDDALNLDYIASIKL